MIERATDPTRSTPRIAARLLVVEARFYGDIADLLVAGAEMAAGAAGARLDRIAVAGALEIPQALAAAVAAGKFGAGGYDGAVALGCVIRGETAHYDIVCNNANHWLMEVAIRHGVPVGNGILTVETRAQALARAEGGLQGKGGDAVAACLGLVALKRDFAGQER